MPRSDSDAISATRIGKPARALAPSTASSRACEAGDTPESIGLNSRFWTSTSLAGSPSASALGAAISAMLARMAVMTASTPIRRTSSQFRRAASSLALLVAVLAALGALPATALADGPVTPTATNYFARVTHVPAGVQAQAVNAYLNLWVRVPATAPRHDPRLPRRAMGAVHA